MNKNVIVTLADSAYYEMLIELIESINSFSESLKVDICVLDAGLNKVQLDYLADKVKDCLLYTSPSPRDLSSSRMPSSA